MKTITIEGQLRTELGKRATRQLRSQDLVIQRAVLAGTDSQQCRQLRVVRRLFVGAVS